MKTNECEWVKILDIETKEISAKVQWLKELLDDKIALTIALGISQVALLEEQLLAMQEYKRVLKKRLSEVYREQNAVDEEVSLNCDGAAAEKAVTLLMVFYETDVGQEFFSAFYELVGDFRDWDDKNIDWNSRSSGRLTKKRDRLINEKIKLRKGYNKPTKNWDYCVVCTIDGSL